MEYILDNIIAKRDTKTIYKDKEYVLKVFNEDYLARVFKARIKVYAVKF